MKKVIALMGLLLGLASISHAGTPQEITVNGPYTNSSIYGSSVTTGSGFTILAAPSSKNSVPGRYCFNEIQVVAANTVGVYFIDGSTVPTNTNNFLVTGLTTSTVNNINTPHLEPLCFTAGNQAGIYSTGIATYTYAGYISYGGAGGSSANAGY